MAVEADTYPELVVSRSDASWMTPAKIKADELVGKVDEYTGYPDRIVDVGTGDAYFCQQLSRRFDADILGVERYGKFLRSLEGQNTHLIEADGTSGIKTGHTDCLCYINSLQAMDDPVEELRSAYSVLREDGIALVTGPTERSAEVFPENAIDRSTQPPQIVTEMEEMETYSQYFFPEGWLAETGEDIGFRVVEEDSIVTDLRGLPALHDHVRPEHRPEVDEQLMEMLRESPDKTMAELLENPGRAPEVGLWVLEK